MAGARRQDAKEVFAQHDDCVWDYVFEKLAEEWSPEQIAGRLRETYPNDAWMQISHETISACIYADRRAGGMLWKQLRRHHRRRYPRGLGRGRRGGIVGRVGIEERPAVVETRRRKGDWEGDTVAGKSGRLVTAVERRSRYVVIAKVADKRSAKAQQKLNNRPRKCLGYRTPHEVLFDE